MKNECEVILSCSNVCKNFGATRALIDVDFELRRGEVCGLIGENGSGKSTLSSIFAGAHFYSNGKLFRNNVPYKPLSMVDAQKAGVAMIVQEAGTLLGLDVASNIFIGNYSAFNTAGFMNNRKMRVEADRILSEIGAGYIKSSTPLNLLNFEDRKIVEIARAMYLQPEVLIIDESTTALAEKGRQIIYRLIKEMRDSNKGVIFISHDLEELERTCNKITCLRDGRVVGHLEGETITTQRMRPMMVGREFEGHYYRSDWDGTSNDEVVLDVHHITSSDGRVKNFCIQLHRGEILGFGGLADCGMHDVGRMIFGLDESITGEIHHVSHNKQIKTVRDAIQQDMAYISKDRDNESIILNASIQENTCMASYSKLSRYGLISRKKEKQVSDEQIKLMRTKCVSGKQFCNQLSGGNKQKVAFSKWLAADSEVFIMDCPTRGIDVGVKAAMYDLIYKFKKRGKSIILISEELSELIGMSDRIIIMKDGAITAEVMRSENVTDTHLIEYMV